MGVLADGGAAIVRGPLDEDERPLVIADDHGPVAISALPFAFEYAARLCFEDDAIACPADVIRAQLASARRYVAEGMRWVVVAHAFVDGAATSESERPLTRMVGGIETVSAASFEGAHYVALGHLHRPQPVGQHHIRYSGAPLAFGFDEEGQQKSVSLIDLAADGIATVTEIPLKPLRQVRAIRGKLLELLATTEVSNDIVRVVLTDDTPQIDPMKRIRAFYPNAVQLSYERNERPVEQRLEEQRAAIDDPQTLSSAFLEFVRSEPLSDAERQIVAAALRSFATLEGDQ
jgi:exonuclease SbcD